MPLLRIIIKITGFIPALFFCFPKKYYLNKRFTTMNYKGPLIIVQNHKGFMDFPIIVFMFLFRKVNVVVSELVFHHSKLMHTLLCAFGAIKADRNTGNPEFINKSVALLKKGKIVLIYPESKIETDDEILEFKNSVGLISMQSGAPVLPIFHNGSFGMFKRDKNFIGDLMYPEDFRKSDKSMAENVKNYTIAIHEKIVSFKAIYDSNMCPTDDSEKTGVQKKKRTFGYSWMLHTTIPLVKLFLRPQISFESYEAKMSLYRQNRMVIISNHTWWLDPPLLYYVFKRRTLSCVAALDVAKKHNITYKLQKVLGCIFLEREGFDYNCLRSCINELENDGALIIFPEGKINLDKKPAEFKPGCAMLSLMTHSPVVPVYIDGTYKLFKKVHITVGSPIDLSKTTDNSVSTDNIEQATDVIYKRLEKLGDKSLTALSSKEKAILDTCKESHREILAKTVAKG